MISKSIWRSYRYKQGKELESVIQADTRNHDVGFVGTSYPVLRAVVDQVVLRLTALGDAQMPPKAESERIFVRALRDAGVPTKPTS